MKPKPPVFHIPIGRQRDGKGKVVLFKDESEQLDSMDAWMEMTTKHPTTLAAGGCVIIGPTQTQYLDLRTRVVTVSKTAEAWEPSALSDWGLRGPR